MGRELAAEPEFGPLIISPPRALRVESMSETGVAIKVLGDTQPVHQWEVTGELRRRLIRAFLEENVRVPFPPHVVAGAALGMERGNKAHAAPGDLLILGQNNDGGIETTSLEAAPAPNEPASTLDLRNRTVPVGHGERARALKASSYGEAIMGMTHGDPEESPATGVLGLSQLAGTPPGVVIHGPAPGVHGISGTGPGVQAHSESGPGVESRSESGPGVDSRSQAGPGVVGVSDTYWAVDGESGNWGAVRGATHASPSPTTQPAFGVFGLAILPGVVGRPPAPEDLGDGTGVCGMSGAGIGVQGESLSGPGVLGHSDSGTGVEGRSESFGVYGQAQIGVMGRSGEPPPPEDGDGKGGIPSAGVLGEAWLEGSAGVMAFSGDGQLLALRVVGKAQFSTAGAGVVPARMSAATVANPAVTADSHITVTFTGNPGSASVAWVERQPGTGFVIHLSSRPRWNVPFTYLIVEPGT